MTTAPFPCARCGGEAEHTLLAKTTDGPAWWTPEQTIAGKAVCAACFLAEPNPSAHQRFAAGTPVDSAAIVAEHLAVIVDLHALIDATTPIFDLEATPTQWDEATQLHRVLRARHRKEHR